MRSGKGSTYSIELSLSVVMLFLKNDVSGRNKLWFLLKSFPPVRISLYDESYGCFYGLVSRVLTR